MARRNESFLLRYGDAEESAPPWPEGRHNSPLEAIAAHHDVPLPADHDRDRAAGRHREDCDAVGRAAEWGRAS